MNATTGRKILDKVYYHTSGYLYVSPWNRKYDPSHWMTQLYRSARMLRAVYELLTAKDKAELRARLRRSVKISVESAWDDHMRRPDIYNAPDRRDPRLTISTPSVSPASFPGRSVSSAEAGGVVSASVEAATV